MGDMWADRLWHVKARAEKTYDRQAVEHVATDQVADHFLMMRTSSTSPRVDYGSNLHVSVKRSRQSQALNTRG